jgi:uncharacterized membrane protein YheB (UPF0754 family)
MIIYTLPVIGALIGWITNYLAVKMLFHPQKEMRIFFYRLQGVFPKRQQAFARKLGAVVSGELFSVHDVTKHLKEKATSEATMGLITRRLEEAMIEKLPQAMPMLALVLNSDLVEKIKYALLEHLKDMIGELIEMLSADLQQDLDVHAIVEEKVASFSSQKLEEILYSIMKREFKFIEVVGAVLGFAIGICQLVLLQLV